ncbi:molybdopterin-dependent oxidoreductase [Inhella sp.]|uniref:molybdopterin-dependent oxidoreductase n=1 Tax=Inhella sp. TaxID=1921806 RepID=UPI0035ADA032
MSDRTAGSYRICPLCEAACGLRIEHAGGQVTRIRGAEDDPFSRGYLCPKAVALKDLHEDPDRLRRPLVKRAGTFVEVDWEEALEEVEAQLLNTLRLYGPDSVAAVIGNPAVHRMGLLAYFPRLVRAIGTGNVFSASTLDQMPKQLSSALMFGHWFSVAVPDVDRCDFLLMLGGNPLASNGSMWTVPDVKARLKELQARGGKLVVVDPRRTETAAIANQHLALRPGSDAYLLLALAATLFEEGLVKPGRLSDHLNGLDELRAFVAPYPPERVAARCGLEATAIRQLARELAAAPRAAVYGRLGTCTQRFGSVNSWLVDALNILTGNLDREGGAMFPKAAGFAANTLPGPAKGVRLGRRKSRVSGAREVYGELPITCLREEITTPGPGQVRALITVASNPVLSCPGGAALDEALGQLDFMLSLDVYVNETTRHADVILPSLSPLQVPHYDIAFSQLSIRNHARWSEALLPADEPDDWEYLLRLTALVQGRNWRAPAAELDDAMLAEELARSLPEAFRAPVRAALGNTPGPARLVDLALRLGPYGDQFGRKPGGLNLAQVRAAPAGIDLGALQPRVPELLRTPSGRIELAPPEFLAEAPALAAALDEPAPELVVIGRRDLRSNNSWMHNLPLLAKGPERCTLQMHPADASQRGLSDGALVRIEGPGGQVQARLELNEALRPGVVSLPHGWGHDQPDTQLRVAAERPGANLNALLSDALRDPLSGNAVLSGVSVSVRPA